MEQRPSWEANWFSACQEILRMLLKLKVHYSIRKSPPPVLILSQLGPVQDDDDNGNDDGYINNNKNNNLLLNLRYFL
jgi:hypothetical protein